YEAELRAARAAWERPEVRADYRTRTQCERLVNQMTRHGCRQARRWGLGPAQLQAHLTALGRKPHPARPCPCRQPPRIQLTPLRVAPYGGAPRSEPWALTRRAPRSRRGGPFRPPWVLTSSRPAAGRPVPSRGRSLRRAPRRGGPFR